MKKEGSSPVRPRCVLVGTDSNVFALAGRVGQALRKAGQYDKAREFTEKLPQCKSYDEALNLMCTYVDVE